MNLNTGIRSAAALGVLLAALSLGGCGDGDNNDNGGTTGGTTGGGSTGGSTGGTTGGGASGDPVYISFDGGGDAGSVDTYNGALTSRTASFDSGLNEGIVDIGGTLNAVGVIGGTSHLRRFDDFATRGSTAFDSEVDDDFTFAEFRAPKGIAVAGLTRNQLIVADAPAAAPGDDPALVPSLHVLTTVVGLTNPNILTTIPVSVAQGRTWDVAYDGGADRLFAAMTNGTVAVYDTFVTRANLASLGGPAVAPSRTITPGRVVGGVSQKISVNLHGISFDRPSGRLILSDVGDAASDSDGALYVIDDAPSASDTATGAGGVAIVEPLREIRGASTLLGNPVDILLRSDGNLYVAEKLNGGGQILVFNGITTGTGGGDLAPNRSVTTASLGSTGGPESIAEPN